MHHLVRLLLLTSLFLPLLPQGAAAQLVQSVRVQADNDAFNFWVPRSVRSDYEYTAGTRVLMHARTARWWGRFAPQYEACGGRELPEQVCLSTLWELGQRIYTPRFNASVEIEGERPHAGWLYGAMTASAARPTDRHAVRLELGVTGPPSLAATMQTVLHRAAGFWEPRGWDKQLAFEPGVMARYEYSRLLGESLLAGRRVADVTHEVGASLGNVRTGAHAGAAMRVGYDVPHPWSRPGAHSTSNASLFLTAGFRGDWVLHDLFLDGNTFRESQRVEKLPLVAHYRLGAGLRVGRAEVDYRVVIRSREYQTEPSGHRYSSISIGFRP